MAVVSASKKTGATIFQPITRMATLIAVYGLFMRAISRGWALFVWGYALLWFRVSDRIKLLAYRIFDPVKAAPQAEVKAPIPLDLTTRIARQAYELYEQHGRHEGFAVQDWLQAEQKILKKEAPK